MLCNIEWYFTWYEYASLYILYLYFIQDLLCWLLRYVTLELGGYGYHPVLPGAKSVRMILGAPYHSYLLSWLAGCVTKDMQIMLRSISFMLRGLQSHQCHQSMTPNFLVSLSLDVSILCVSKNIKHVVYKCCIYHVYVSICLYQLYSLTCFQRSWNASMQ